MNAQRMKTAIEKESTVNHAAEECCPQFDATRWDHVEHKWEDKLFLKDSIPEVFHIPLPWAYGKAITSMMQKAQESGAAPDRKDFYYWLMILLPSRGNCIWRSPKKSRAKKM